MIIRKCLMKGWRVSEGTVTNIINCKGKKREAERKGEIFGHKPHPRSVRNKQLVSQVTHMVDMDNPPSQRSIARHLHVSKGTISRVIRQDLKMEAKRKTKVHALKRSHIKERKTNTRKLYEFHLAAERYKYVVTVDEAWVYLSDCKRNRHTYYRKQGEKEGKKFFQECKESFPLGFMVTAGFSHKGKLKIRKVGGNVKINASYYQKKVLDPIFHQESPQLYPSEVTKVNKVKFQ